ncbi:hypothetical protein F4806DRAFT_498641 [Annulohypoxylon nitens]|nr:hypothetical protein F4806DRAFT_498641 [Annulohypoxylon nitens]
MRSSVPLKACVCTSSICSSTHRETDRQKCGQVVPTGEDVVCPLRVREQFAARLPTPSAPLDSAYVDFVKKSDWASRAPTVPRPPPHDRLMWTSTSALGGGCEREVNPFLEWEPASDPSPKVGGSPTGLESHLQASCAAVRCGKVAVNRKPLLESKKLLCPCRSGMVSPCLGPSGLTHEPVRASKCLRSEKFGAPSSMLMQPSIYIVGEQVPTDQPRGCLLE